MSESDRELSPNRSVALELRDELQLVREGYSMLDEKRTLLAVEILRRLERYNARQAQLDELLRRARSALIAAAGRHGLEGLQVYPPLRLAGYALRVVARRSVAVEALSADPHVDATELASEPINPSPEAAACAQAHLEVLLQAGALAAEGLTLRRLAREYQRTERRARALEMVLMPELTASLHFIEEQLELHEIEEAVRVHEAHRMRQQGV